MHALQEVYAPLKKRLQFPDGFLPGQNAPRTSHTTVPDTPVVALIDSRSHKSLGPVALKTFKNYLGDDHVILSRPFGFLLSRNFTWSPHAGSTPESTGNQHSQAALRCLPNTPLNCRFSICLPLPWRLPSRVCMPSSRSCIVKDTLRHNTLQARSASCLWPTTSASTRLCR